MIFSNCTAVVLLSFQSTHWMQQFSKTLKMTTKIDGALTRNTTKFKGWVTEAIRCVYKPWKTSEFFAGALTVRQCVMQRLQFAACTALWTRLEHQLPLVCTKRLSSDDVKRLQIMGRAGNHVPPSQERYLLTDKRPAFFSTDTKWLCAQRKA
jgi:hypothetical protein